jgi:hypothetical protein
VAVVVKLAYKPLGLIVSVLGGLLASAVFNKVWGLLAAGDEAPDATDARASWRQVLLAAAVQGAVSRGSAWDQPTQPSHAEGLGQILGVDLAAQGEALGADGGVAGYFAAGRVVHGGGETGELPAVLAAEAAPVTRRTVRDGLDWTERGLGGASGTDDCLGHRHALLADVYARTGHKSAGSALQLRAE